MKTNTKVNAAGFQKNHKNTTDSGLRVRTAVKAGKVRLSDVLVSSFN